LYQQYRAFPYEPSEFTSFAVEKTYWQMGTLASDYQTMLFLESLTVLCCFVNLLTLLRSFAPLDFWMINLVNSIRLVFMTLGFQIDLLMILAVIINLLYVIPIDTG
jgi:hypothetical protein